MKLTRYLCAFLCLFVFAGEDEEPKVSSSVDLKFWGRAFFDVHYDTADLRGQTDWATYLTAEEPEEVNFNPRDTRFGFSASSTFDGYKARAVAEIDFHGSNAGNNLLPRLRLGYAELSKDDWSLRAGQDWIPIASQNPNMIEFGILAWGGNLWWRVPQITFRKKNGDWEYLTSLMKHRISSSQEQQEKMPWVVGKVSKKHNKSYFALGAAFRDVEVDEESYSPYLICLEYKTGFGDKVTLNGEIWQGAGMGREFVRYGLDYNRNQGTEIDGFGGFACLNFKTSGKSQYNLGVGIDDPKDEDAQFENQVIAGVPFVKNTVFFANWKRPLSKQFGYGLEWMNFKTDQTPETSLKGDRFTLGIWYIF